MDWNKKLLFSAQKGDYQSALICFENAASTRFADQHGNTILHWAATHKSRRLVDLVVDYGGALEARNVLGVTPLHLACQHNCQETVVALLEHGADLQAKDRFGKTPFDHAVRARGVATVIAIAMSVNGSLTAPIQGKTLLEHFSGCALSRLEIKRAMEGLSRSYAKRQGRVSYAPELPDSLLKPVVVPPKDSSGV